MSIRCWILSIAFACGVCAGPAHGQLMGLAHDVSTGAERVVQIDPGTGAATPVGAGLAACCVLGTSSVVNDPFAQIVYSAGRSPSGAWQLYAHRMPAGDGTLVGTVGTERILGLGFERTTQRVLGLIAAADNSVRLVSINKTTAAPTTIHNGLTDCCVLEPGALAVSAGNLWFVGRLRTDPAGTRTLYGWSISGTQSVTSMALPAGTTLAALTVDPTTDRLYALLQISGPPTPATQLHQVVPGIGLFGIGNALAFCCALAPDSATIEGGRLRVIGRTLPLTSLQPQLLSFDLSAGVFTASASPLPAGIRVNGLYEQLKGLLASTTTITSINPSPSTVGQPYMVQVSVTASVTPTGTVTVGDGQGATCSIVLPANSCQLISTSAGAVTVTAQYGGSTNLAGGTDTEPHTVLRAASTTQITSVIASPSVVGQSYSVNVAVAGFLPTGTITVDDGLGANCNITLPATSCTLNSVNTGPRTLTASYPGDGNNLPSSATQPHSVVAAASTTSIVSIVASPATVGVASTVTVAVSGFGVLTGTVQITIDGGGSCLITLPALSCALTPGTAGARVVTAAYSGDSNNLSSSATQALTVNRAASATTITSVSPSPATAGQAYTVNASVSGFGTPAGTVIISDDAGASCTITLPAAGCALTSVVAGNRTLTASYGGDVNNLPSSDTEAQLVNPAATTTALAAAPSPAYVNFTLTLTATIGAGVAPRTGTVAFTADGTPIAGCGAVAVSANSATCSTSFASSGTRALLASYSGDANNLPSTGALSLNVVQAPSTTTISATPNPVAPGAGVVLDVSVSGPAGVPSGTVSISADGVPIATCQNLPLGAGLAQCSATFGAPGQIQLLASYSGDAVYLPSTGSLTLSVLLIAIPALNLYGLLLLIGAIGLLAYRRY